MTDNKYFWILLNQSWAVSYPLTHTRLSVWASVIVVVSTFLLLLFRPFSFVFHCETVARDSVATMWENVWTYECNHIIKDSNTGLTNIFCSCVTMTKKQTRKLLYKSNITVAAAAGLNISLARLTNNTLACVILLNYLIKTGNVYEGEGEWKFRSRSFVAGKGIQ